MVVIPLDKNEQQGWTMKQIADELGVNKMRVYRTISRLNLKEAYKKGQALYFDVTAKTAIENAIRQTGTTTSNQSATGSQSSIANEFAESLNDRIKSQQDQIENLTKLLDQSQRLQLVAEKRTSEAEKKIGVLQKQMALISAPNSGNLTTSSERSIDSADLDNENHNYLDPDYFDKAQAAEANGATGTATKEKNEQKKQTEGIIPKPEKNGSFFKHFWQKPLL